jgi:hypothetical protein
MDISLEVKMDKIYLFYPLKKLVMISNDESSISTLAIKNTKIYNS